MIYCTTVQNPTVSCGYSNSKPLSSFLDTSERGSIQIMSPTKTQNSPLLQAAGPSHYLRIPMLISTSSPSFTAFIIKSFFTKFSLTIWEHIDFSFFLSQQLELFNVRGKNDLRLDLG